MKTGNVSEIIGNTPLIKIESLSKMTGCQIYAKAEFLNPGGSIKDRTAKFIIEDAEKKSLIKSGDTIVEGTAGNTGIGLATIAAQKNYKCKIVMPNNQSIEKINALRALNAEVMLVNPCPFSDQNHFYHTARRISEQESNTFWANQFENTSNYLGHYSTTGAEIWDQTNNKIDFFICSAGTGGTIAGVSKYLKEKNYNAIIVLADPHGSGLCSYIKNKEIKSTGSSITEGIGIMRITENFKNAKIDDAITISDQEMIEMLYHIAQHDGLLIGTSGALNLRATYEIAKQNQGSNKTFVTIIGDHGTRYQSKVFNPDWLKEKSLSIGHLK